MQNQSIALLASSGASNSSSRDQASKPVFGAMLCALVLVGCSAGPDEAMEVALAELAANAAAYEARLVRTRGVVRAFDDPRHYWLEDAYVNRVGLEPPALVAPHLGREIAVVGRYHYTRERGRRLVVSAVEPFETAR